MTGGAIPQAEPATTRTPGLICRGFIFVGVRHEPNAIVLTRLIGELGGFGYRGGSATLAWTAADASRHTKLARTPGLQRVWASIANAHADPVTAVRKANAAIARMVGATRRSDEVRRKIARTAKAGRKAGWLRL